MSEKEVPGVDTHELAVEPGQPAVLGRLRDGLRGDPLSTGTAGAIMIERWIIA